MENWINSQRKLQVLGTSFGIHLSLVTASESILLGVRRQKIIESLFLITALKGLSNVNYGLCQTRLMHGHWKG